MGDSVGTLVGFDAGDSVGTGMMCLVSYNEVKLARLSFPLHNNDENREFGKRRLSKITMDTWGRSKEGRKEGRKNETEEERKDGCD